jgi:hypothetical protein
MTQVYEALPGGLRCQGCGALVAYGGEMTTHDRAHDLQEVRRIMAGERADDDPQPRDRKGEES